MFLFILFAAGCATIVQGTRQKIEISSDPLGAAVEIDGETVGITPIKVKLKTPFDHTVIIKKEGYEQEKITLSRVIGSAACGNIFVWGPAGWALDGLTGSQYRLAPEKVHVELREEK